MQTIYKMKAEELNEDFLQSVKTLFHGKSIEISVSDAKFEAAGAKTASPRKAGALAGRIKIAEDFNTP